MFKIFTKKEKERIMNIDSLIISFHDWGKSENNQYTLSINLKIGDCLKQIYLEDKEARKVLDHLPLSLIPLIAEKSVELEEIA